MNTIFRTKDLFWSIHLDMKTHSHTLTFCYCKWLPQIRHGEDGRVQWLCLMWEMLSIYRHTVLSTRNQFRQCRLLFFKAATTGAKLQQDFLYFSNEKTNKHFLSHTTRQRLDEGPRQLSMVLMPTAYFQRSKSGHFHFLEGLNNSSISTTFTTPRKCLEVPTRL